MLRPTLDEVMQNLVSSFDDIIKPDISDPYASSLALTLSNLLRHVRVRARLEPQALWIDNADLRELLIRLGVPAPARIPTDVYPSIDRLLDEAFALRSALDGYVLEHPGHPEVLAYLSRQLARQRPWMMDAWSGPRR